MAAKDDMTIDEEVDQAVYDLMLRLPDVPLNIPERFEAEMVEKIGSRNYISLSKLEKYCTKNNKSGIVLGRMASKPQAHIGMPAAQCVSKAQSYLVAPNQNELSGTWRFRNNPKKDDKNYKPAFAQYVEESGSEIVCEAFEPYGPGLDPNLGIGSVMLFKAGDGLGRAVKDISENNPQHMEGAYLDFVVCSVCKRTGDVQLKMAKKEDYMIE